MKYENGKEGMNFRVFEDIQQFKIPLLFPFWKARIFYHPVMYQDFWTLQDTSALLLSYSKNEVFEYEEPQGTMESRIVALGHCIYAGGFWPYSQDWDEKYPCPKYHRADCEG